MQIPENIAKELKRDNAKKKYVISFPLDDIEPITSENIVADSVTFTESVNSSDDIDLGLCESSVFEFSAYDVPDIKGKVIDIVLLVGEEEYSIPYGRFIVDSCRRDADNDKLRKVMCYSIADVQRPSVLKSIQAATKGTSRVGVLPLFLASTVANDAEGLTYTTDSGRQDTTTDSIIISSTTNLYIRIKGITRKRYVGSTTSTDRYLYYLDNYFFDYANWNQLVEHIKRKLIELKDGDYATQADTLLNSFDEKMELCKRKYCKANAIYTNSSGSIDLYTYHYDVSGFGLAVVLGLSSGLSVNVPSSVHFEIVKMGTVYDETDVQVSSGNDNLRWYALGEYTESLAFQRVKAGTYYKAIIPDDLDIREYMEAMLELHGKYGYFARNGAFRIADLGAEYSVCNNDVLCGDLMPSGNHRIITRKEYEKVEYDDAEIIPYGLVTCTYNNGTEDVYAEVAIDGIEDGAPYRVYDISNNALIVGNTSLTATKVNGYLTTIANALKKIKYRPATIVAMGIPDLEAGDMIEVVTEKDSFITYALRKQTRGIDFLEDTIEAR